MLASVWSPVRTNIRTHNSSGWEETLNASVEDVSRQRRIWKITDKTFILAGGNRWNLDYLDLHLDLCSRSSWGWTTWWGTYSRAASAMAPGGRTGLKVGTWMSWDQRWGGYFLSSNGHSPPSGSPLWTKMGRWSRKTPLLWSCYI